MSMSICLYVYVYMSMSICLYVYLRAEDIGITWQGGDTFLHGVRVAGPREDMEDTRHRPAMSTPYPPGREHPSCDMSTPRFPRPVCIEMSDTPTHRTGQEGRPSHRPAAPIQQNHRVASLVTSFQSGGRCTRMG